jgi:hypothetical protein
LFKHEKANNSYSVEAAFLSDLLFTATAVLITIVPATAITFFMIGLPKEAYPFCLFTFWVVSPLMISPTYFIGQLEFLFNLKRFYFL